ncbi:DUF421 domain-containing protein [Rudanella paleaurantiibacter]|uniref:DUF421 domain-containing protein n=1 Tax=Rudanella paleaurantiibacter TaxID=2614655 RepID=A0A7J5U3W8_9BACT|nr:YetF domain-containing protein [Rudanella paleaurantiibacter]KAB7732538.1 DUF421 domain-containing protein [Rudanella paleaurantiibacter]
MKKEEIHLADWQRILLGEAPAEFMLEVLLRSVLIVLFFSVIARLLGKRMNGQVSPTELAVMLSLGAVIAPAMQLPDRGVLMGVLALTAVLAFQRGITWLGFKNSSFEEVSQGVETVLVKNGILQLDQMAECRISRQQLFAVLRAANVYNLSGVERVYMEACGLFSIYPTDQPLPGLSTLPLHSDALKEAILTGIQEPVAGVSACNHCGNTVPQQQATHACPVCGDTDWTGAIR